MESRGSIDLSKNIKRAAEARNLMYLCILYRGGNVEREKGKEQGWAKDGVAGKG